MTAKIILEDDNRDRQNIAVEPELVINITDYFIPCICGRVVLLEIDGNDADGCHVCKREDCVKLNDIHDDPKQIMDWLVAWDWDYEHPGYWKHLKPYGCIMVGEYVGFYIGDPGVDGNEAFMTIDYENYESQVSLLKAQNLIDDDDERHIRLAIRHEELLDDAKKPHWEWEGGSLMYPDGILIYNRLKPKNRIEIHQRILINDEDRPLQDDEHEYLRDLADLITRWLNNNVA